jgi:carboxypeptidase family protein
MTRLLLSGLAFSLCLGGVAEAQNTSQVFGKVTDVSGAVMPGVTVTLSSPALLEPRVALTSVTGTYEFSGLSIGIYTVKFELSGFGTQVHEGLQLQSGFSAQVNIELQVASLEESVLVTGASPIVDIRSTTQGTRFNVQELEAIPSARDVFQVLTQTPGVAGDR